MIAGRDYQDKATVASVSFCPELLQPPRATAVGGVVRICSLHELLPELLMRPEVLSGSAAAPTGSSTSSCCCCCRRWCTDLLLPPQAPPRDAAGEALFLLRYSFELWLFCHLPCDSWSCSSIIRISSTLMPCAAVILFKHFATAVNS